MTVDVQLLGHVGLTYYRRRENVLRQPSPAQVAALLDEVCATSDHPAWWTNVNVGDPDGVDGVQVVVSPQTGYVALMWTGTGERSLNPHPFADAPLEPDNWDDDPLVYWPRSSFLAPADAKRAIAEHIETGVQPTSVLWQPWGFEVLRLPDWLTPDMPEYSSFHLITE
jgi:hypothetical protein